MELLDLTLTSTYIPATIKLCPITATDSNLLAAISDFTYNLGSTRLAGSTLRKKLNRGDIEGAKKELRKWVRGGGSTLPGLVKRREAEINLIGDYHGRHP